MSKTVFPASASMLAPLLGLAMAGCQVNALPDDCPRCGVVQQIQSKTVEGPSNPAAAVAGAVLGGVLGHQIGGGRGKDVATAAGAVGGAVVGDRIARQRGARSYYEVTVELESGQQEQVAMQSLEGLRPGDAVRIADGTLVRL